MNFDLTGNIGMGTAVRRCGFIYRQDNDFDPATIEGIGQFNQHPPIFDLFKKPFYVHVASLLLIFHIVTLIIECPIITPCACQGFNTVGPC